MKGMHKLKEKAVDHMPGRTEGELSAELLENIRMNLQVRTLITLFFIPTFTVLKIVFDLRIPSLLFLLFGFLFLLSTIYFFIFLRWKIFRTLRSLSIGSTVITVLDLLLLGIVIFYIGGFAFGGLLAFPLYIIYAYLVYPFRWQSNTVLGATILFFLSAAFLEYFGVIAPQYITPPGARTFRDPSFVGVYLTTTVGLLWFVGYYSRIFSNKLREKSRALLLERNRLDAVFTHLPGGVLVFDGSGRILYMNPPVGNLLGVTVESGTGLLLNNIPAPPKAQPALRLLAEWLAHSWDGESRQITMFDSQERIFQIRAMGIPDPFGGQRILSVAIFQDITREVFISKMKSEFISVAAHQLRTPLSAIKWSTNLLMEGEYGTLGKEQRKAIEADYQQIERMIRVVGALLDVAAIEEGRYNYHFSLQQLEPILQDMTKAFIPQAEQRKVTLSLELPPRPLPKLYIDPERIRIALENLFENAIFYNQGGGRVSISVNQDENHVKIIVHDTGIGISPQDLPRLFSKFFRAPNAIRKQTEGYGLGLYISQNIIQAHGGTIAVQSEEDKGSTFTVTLSISEGR